MSQQRMAGPATIRGYVACYACLSVALEKSFLVICFEFGRLLAMCGLAAFGVLRTILLYADWLL